METGELIPPSNQGKLTKPAIASVVAVAAIHRTFYDHVQDDTDVAWNAGDSPYHHHIDELNKTLQERLAQYPELDMSIKLIVVNTINEKIRQIIRRGFEEDEEGRAWPNQIETLVDTVAAIIQDPKRSVVIIGSTQLGKTMTVILMAVLEMLLFAKTKAWYKVIYLTPKHLNIKNQTDQDFQGFLNLYDFEVTHNGRTGKYSTHRTQMISRNIRDPENPEHDLPVYARTYGQNCEGLRKILQHYHDKGAKVIFVVDECHWGSECAVSDDNGSMRRKDSIMAQMLRFAQELTEEAQGDLVIAISATPFNWNLSKLTKVFCHTYLGYVGYAFWCGHLLDERYPLLKPDVYGFSSDYIRRILGIQDFNHVNRAWYRNKVAFDRNRKVTKKRGPNKGELTDFAKRWYNCQWDEYRRFCENKLIELIEACLIRHNDKNAKGFIIRFFVSNEEITDFIKRRANDFPKDIHVIAWNEYSAKESLDVCLKNAGVGPDDMKAVFVSGNGRMGARIPNRLKIYYGADFSEKSTLTAVLQGLLGRMTGNKSEVPTMFLHDNMHDILKEYVDSLGRKAHNPHERTTQVNQNAVSKVNIVFRCEPLRKPLPGNYRLEDIGLKDFENFIVNMTKDHLSGVEKLNIHRSLPAEVKKEFWERFNKAMIKAETTLGLPPNTIVLYKPDFENLARPYIDESGCSYDGVVGFRAMTEDYWSGNLKSRTKLPNLDDDEGKLDGKLQPQIHVSHRVRGRGHEWKVISLRVRLFRKASLGDTINLPKHIDIGSWWANEEEEKLINAAESRSRRGHKTN